MNANPSENPSMLMWLADKWLLGIVLITILARLVVLVLSMQLTLVGELLDVGDAIGYSQLADNLIRLGVFHFEDGGPTAFRMPGYPFFLAAIDAVGGASLMTRLVQILFDALTAIFVFAASMVVSGRKPVAIVSALIIALHPWLVLTSLTLIPDTLATTICAAFTLVALLMLDREKSMQKGGKYGEGALIAVLAGLGIYLTRLWQ